MAVTAPTTSRRIAHRAPRAPRTAVGAALAIEARLRAPALDARLAAPGEVPGDRALAARARQLVSPRSRRRLARAIESLDADQAGHAARSAAVPVDAKALELAAPALEQLASALHRLDRIDARGVALARRLLVDPSSPLYRPQHPAEVYEAARQALLAL